MPTRESNPFMKSATSNKLSPSSPIDAHTDMDTRSDEHAKGKASVKPDASDSSSSVSRASQHASPEPGVGSQVKRAAEHVVDEAQELLHDAGAMAVDSYRAGSAYLEHKAQVIGERTERIVESATTQAKKTGRVMTRFVAANVGPLVLVGTGLGWLTLRMLGQRRHPRTPSVTLRRAIPVHHSPSPIRTSNAPASAPTISGSKLIGVRTNDSVYANE